MLPDSPEDCCNQFLGERRSPTRSQTGQERYRKLAISPRKRPTLVLYPHPDHRYRRRRAVAGKVGVEPVAAQGALDPQAAVYLVDQIARDRVDLVAAAVALIVERAPGEFSDGREPAAKIVIGFHGVSVRQHAGDAG